jgi:hypothetical protein
MKIFSQRNMTIHTQIGTYIPKLLNPKLIEML